MMKSQKYSFIVPLIIFILLIGIAAYSMYYIQKSKQSVVIDPVDNIVEDTGFNCQNIKKIDGVCFEGDEPGLYAVMIDNHSWARPQSGLSKASLVFETIVESPITRFLAVFSNDQEIEKIGPVRSARPFYIDWVKEFNAPYIHVGGSNDALEILSSTYDYDLNEFSNGQYFWRQVSRSAPHNTYTSSELVNKALSKYNWPADNNYESWMFKSELAESDRGAFTDLNINFGSYEARVRWVYTKETNQYTRYQAGEAHLDDGEMINAKNIAVMYTTGSVIDDYGRRETKTIGEGEAEIFQDGLVIKGTWKRLNLNSRTRFYNENGEEIKFNSGPTWIEIIPGNFVEVNYE